MTPKGPKSASPARFSCRIYPNSSNEVQRLHVFGQTRTGTAIMSQHYERGSRESGPCKAGWVARRRVCQCSRLLAGFGSTMWSRGSCLHGGRSGWISLPGPKGGNCRKAGMKVWPGTACDAGATSSGFPGTKELGPRSVRSARSTADSRGRWRRTVRGRSARRSPVADSGGTIAKPCFAADGPRLGFKRLDWFSTGIPRFRSILATVQAQAAGSVCRWNGEGCTAEPESRADKRICRSLTAGGPGRTSGSGSSARPARPVKIE